MRVWLSLLFLIGFGCGDDDGVGPVDSGPTNDSSMSDGGGADAMVRMDFVVNP